MYNNIVVFYTKSKTKRRKIMKKFLALLLTFILVLSLVSCDPIVKNDNDDDDDDDGKESSSIESTADATEPEATEPADTTPEFDPSIKSEGVMTYAEFMAAEIDAVVTVEAFVQGHQSWWSDKITVYAQDKDGGYFFYELACSEEDAAKLVPGTRIKVTGTKAEWGGEIEIMNGTMEILEGSWIAPAADLTDLLGTDDLIAKMNTLAAFKGLTVKAVEYKNGTPGDDVYLTLSKGDADYSFCVEIYLTGEDSDVYKTVADLEIGNVVDVECFVYWYNGANPHVTDITIVTGSSINDKSEGVMTYEEFMAAEIDAVVTVEAYVQGHQSWWNDKLTVYAQDLDGGYFFYELACSLEDAAKLVPGTKIKVTGTKAEWGGEIEIMGGTMEILEGSWIAPAADLTDLLGTDDLIAKMNTLAAFKGLTVKAVEYKNGTPGDDVYLTLSKGDADYSFCVEIYLTGEDSDVYKTVATLNAGDVVDVECFVYWYNGANPHVTSITLAK